MSSALFEHTATVLNSGKVLVVGGRSDSTVYAGAYLYDPAGSGSWSPTGPLTYARHGHTATLLSSGKVLVTGGSDGSGPIASVEIYNPATGSWAAATGMTQSRAFHTATEVAHWYDDDSNPATPDVQEPWVLVAGGQTDFWNVTSDFELYDPEDDTWLLGYDFGQSLVEGRSRHTATLLSSGEVLLAGGNAGSDLASAELYDPVSQTFSSTNTMGDEHSGHTATLLSSGKVLVAGGYSNTNATAGAELYDPTTGNWSSTGSMGSTRANHTASLVSGVVLVTGGDNATSFGGGYRATAEVYDPSTGTWSATATMTDTRSFHTASVVSGNVLVVGGKYNNLDYSQNSAELYTP